MTRPAPRPISIPHDGGAFSGWHWENPAAPPLLFCHATGFNAASYRQMLGRVARTYNIYAIDMRGHGRSSLPADLDLHRGWQMYADDINAFLDYLDKGEPWILSGHSMGATACVIAGKDRKDIAAFRLIEPVIVPQLPSYVGNFIMDRVIARTLPVAQAAASRRDSWPSVEDVRASYRNKPLFRHFAPGVLDDYLADGLIRCDTGVSLACRPAWEAETFRGSAKSAWDSFKAAANRLTILYTDDKSSTVFKRSLPPLRKMGVKIHRVRDMSHLLAFEDLALAAEFIRTGSGTETGGR